MTNEFTYRVEMIPTRISASADNRSCSAVLRAVPAGGWRSGSVPRGLEQKPDSALAFVDPVLKKARAGKVAFLVAKRVGRAHACHQ